MEYLPLFFIPFLYILVAMVKPALSKRLPFNLCAICVAVSLTWAALLIAWFAGVTIQPLTIGILMGMSVSGLMYKSEALYAKWHIKNFWFVRLVIIVGGFYSIYWLLNREWFYLSFVAVTSLIALILATFLFQEITHEQAVGTGNKKSTLAHKLDNCC